MKLYNKLVMTGAIAALSFSLVFGAEREGQAGQERGLEAQQQQEQEREQQEFGARAEAEARIKASELKGSAVKSQDDQQLGHVADVAVDLETGELAFILVSEEENGEEWTPVPSTAVEIQEENGQIELTVNIDQQEWGNIEKITEDQVAQLGQEQRAREIYESFGEDYEARQQEVREFAAPDRERQLEQPEHRRPEAEQPDLQQLRAEQPGAQQPGAQPREEPQAQPPTEAPPEFGAPQRERELQLGSKLMEARIDAPDQEGAAQISDLILNLQDGLVDMVVMESEFVEGAFAVAPQAFEAVQEDQFRLNVSRQDLEIAQQLSAEQIDQHARQARMEAEQARQDPRVFRIEPDEIVFGAPDRERDKAPKEKEKEKDEAPRY